jgi:hypothetical protein
MFMRVNSRCAHQVRPPLPPIQKLVKVGLPLLSGSGRINGHYS